jgi:chromosome segregation ATPase
MRTIKIGILFLLPALLLAGCGTHSEDTVSKAEYEQLLQEYADLQAGAEATRKEYAAQAAAVDNILQELSQISGRTVTLRTDIEHGTAQLTQVEQIQDSIDDIKEKLDRLEKEGAQYKKTILNLRKVITEKEAEIEQLKAEIEARDQTISEQHQTIAEQHGTIQSQNETISAQRENLRAAVQEQAQMLFQAGVDFEEIGDSAPDMFWRRDKEKVKAQVRELYQKAILYYRMAQETGYPEASYRISQVEEKLEKL